MSSIIQYVHAALSRCFRLADLSHSSFRKAWTDCTRSPVGQAETGMTQIASSSIEVKTLLAFSH
jgi:hypothetical protein